MEETLPESNPEIPITPVGEGEDEAMNGEDQPAADSDSDSDSDDSDSEDEAQQNLQLQTLEAELSSNPFNYDAHVQYIKLLRKMGDIDKLRQAREAMSEIYPLTPGMWQEWAKDETSLMAGPESYGVVENIYERGVSDYLSVSLWCDYLNFIQEHDPSVRECSPVGVSKARNLFERALTAAGLHVSEGNKLWEVYREYEQAILLTIGESEKEEREKQLQHVRSIFQRQLSVPLADMKLTLHAYKAWEAEQGSNVDPSSSELDGITPQVASAYQKALEMYNARVNYEEQISRKDISESERLQQFMTYLKFEQSSGDPARVQVLYERAISEFPISSDLWLGYTSYLDKTLKVGNVVKDVYSRATQNCSWVGELWVRYLLCLERGCASEKQIASVFDKSLQCTFSTVDEYLDLFLTRIDGLRRRMSSTGEVEGVLDYSLIRETFQHASDYLAQHMKNIDGLLRLYTYWARLEVKLGKDLTAARGVWESLLKICGSMLEAWQGYIAMEIELGHIKEARSVYKRCYSKRFPGTGSEDICHSWLRFEREFGTLEDFDHALQKVTPRMEELQLYRLQQDLRSTEHDENVPKKVTSEKRKSGPKLTDEHTPAKRKKNDKSQAQSLGGPSKDGKAEVEVNKSGGANEKQLRESRPEKPKVYSDQCTVFISNLNPKANSEDLRSFFSDVGGVSAIRILHDKFTGKSRGLAYVDFSDDARLAAALQKNKQYLLGKKLSIARSDPKQARKGSTNHGIPTEHGQGSDQGGTKTSRASQSSQSTNKRDSSNIQLKGKNTFAMPRAVRPLGWTGNKPKNVEAEDENPKSNDEFRKMFIKG